MSLSTKLGAAIVCLVMLAACREKPLSFPFVQKYQVTPGDLFYFRSDGQFVALERRKALDIAVSPVGWEAYSYPSKITMSRPVERKPGDFHGSGPAAPTLMENNPFTETPAAMEHLVFSPTGAVLAGGSSDGTFGAWDVATGQELQLHQPGGILSLAFSPDGTMVAVGIGTHTAVEAGTVRLFNYPTGVLRAHFGTSPGTAVAFTSEGALIAGFADGTWQVRSAAGELLPPVKASESPVAGLAVHPATGALASAQGDKQIHLWNPVTGKRMGTLTSEIPANPLFPRAIERIAFNSTGTQLAAAYADGEMRIWDTSALKPPLPQ